MPPPAAPSPASGPQSPSWRHRHRRLLRWGLAALLILAVSQGAGLLIEPPAPTAGSYLLRAASQARMLRLWTALEAWRERHGAGRRYPESLDALVEAGLVEPRDLVVPDRAGDAEAAPGYLYEPGLTADMPPELVVLAERVPLHEAPLGATRVPMRWVLLLDGSFARAEGALPAGVRLAPEQDRALDWWRAGPPPAERRRLAASPRHDLGDLMRSVAIWSLAADPSASLRAGSPAAQDDDGTAAALAVRCALAESTAALDRARGPGALLAVLRALAAQPLVLDGRPVARDARPYERLAVARLFAAQGRTREAETLCLSLLAVEFPRQRWLDPALNRLMAFESLRPLWAEPLRRHALALWRRLTGRPGDLQPLAMLELGAADPALAALAADWRR